MMKTKKTKARAFAKKSIAQIRRRLINLVCDVWQGRASRAGDQDGYEHYGFFTLTINPAQ